MSHGHNPCFASSWSPTMLAFDHEIRQMRGIKETKQLVKEFLNGDISEDDIRGRWNAHKVTEHPDVRNNDGKLMMFSSEGPRTPGDTLTWLGYASHEWVDIGHKELISNGDSAD